MADLQPVVTVIAGPNGSGKTTLTKQLLAHEWTARSTYVNADEIAQHKYGDWNSPQAIRQAANLADELRAKYLRDRQSFTYETVFSTARRLEDLERALANGFFIRFFFVSTDDPLTNIERVRRRVQLGGHDVPHDKIRARYQRSIGNLVPALNIVNRGYLFDNSAFEQDPLPLLRTVDGKVAKIYCEPLPSWATRALTRLQSA